MIKNTENSYGIISKLLHWTMSIVIITLICVGYYMSDLPASPEKFEIYGMHKATGVIILSLALIRIFWKYRNITPSLPENLPHWQAAASKINTGLLYFLMFLMPLSGLFMSLYSGYAVNVFGLFTIPAFERKERLATLAKEFHEAFAVILIVSISLHVAAALYHHFIRKDELLKRMIK